MKLIVYGPLRGATGGKEVDIEFDGGIVDDALSALVDAYPRAKAQLFDDEGSLRPSVRIQVDGNRVEPDDDCPADAEVTVVPAMRGGLK